MPIFYFDLINDLEVRDEEGRELPDVSAARDAAVLEAREMITEAARQGELDLNHRIEVRNEEGAVVHVLLYGEAVEIVPVRQPPSRGK
jgi:hypothetical protein